MEQQSNLIASVAGNAGDIHVLIIGAGRGCLAFLDVFSHYHWLHVDTVADKDPQASAFPVATSSGIDCTTDVDGVLAHFKGDMIIDLTGDTKFGLRLVTMPALQNVEIIAGKSAKLMFDLVYEQIQDKHHMEMQGERLDLLGTLLDTSMELGTDVSLSKLAYQSLNTLRGHISAVKGMAILFEETHKPEIVGAVGMPQPSLTPQLYRQLSDLSCHHEMPRQHFHQLVTTICISDIAFNVWLPVWHENILIACLLFETPVPITPVHQTILNMTTKHLNMAAKNLYQRKHLEDLAFHDGLTHAFNRRYLMEKLDQETSRTRRQPHAALACAFIDLDSLKQINDTYGHQAGDQALKYVVDCIRHSVREYDLIARYGGDEFVVLMPLDNEQASHSVEKVGERILQLVRSGEFSEYVEMRTSVSIGIAVQSSRHLKNSKALLASADQAVYCAKASGKDRLHVTMNM
ncbi:MAG: GGDEF domain-containing protein [Mariprofundales bacterium]|nr:GGDEF domain-containing protein [Mariprofundales bacterium]